MKFYKNIPLIILDVDLEDDFTGMYANSGVYDPAVGIEKYCFSNPIELQRFDSNSKEQIITSVSILADTPIERKDKNGDRYYVMFDKKSIQNIRNKRIKSGTQNNFTLYHDSTKKVEGIYLVESFIHRKDRAESKLFEVPEGSLIDTYWVEDRTQYDKLVNDDKFKGFSIEINAGQRERYDNLDDIDTVIQMQEILSSNFSKTKKKELIKKLLKK